MYRQAVPTLDLRGDGRSWGGIPTLNYFESSDLEATKNEILADARARYRQAQLARVLDLASDIDSAKARLLQLQPDEVTPEC